jgi:hypothetical protein
MDQTKCNCPVSQKYGEHYDGCPVCASLLRDRIAELESSNAELRAVVAVHEETIAELRDENERLQELIKKKIDEEVHECRVTFGLYCADCVDMKPTCWVVKARDALKGRG